MAPQHNGGLGGNGAAALASGFNEAVGDDPLGLADAAGVGERGRGRDIAATDATTGGEADSLEDKGDGEG